MGMWDKAFADISDSTETGPRLRDIAKLFIPLVGPIVGVKSHLKNQQKLRNKWISDNMAYNDPSQLDEMGRRVQDRMLSRTGGELSTPGLMTSTILQREAGDPINSGNFGNALMQTASQLAAHGQGQAATTLAAEAHKNFQTPWKPSDSGTDKPINLKLPDGTVQAVSTPQEAQIVLKKFPGTQVAGVASAEPEYPISILTGAQLGIGGSSAGDPFEVQYYDKERTRVKNVSTLGKDKMSIYGPDLGALGDLMLNQPKIMELMTNVSGAVIEAQDTSRKTNELSNILKETPYGVTGWGGYLTALGSKAANLTGFLGSLQSKFNDKGESEAQVFGRYGNRMTQLSQKISSALPVEQQASAQNLLLSLAYQVARMNNMGTAGGGRGITDADMEYALQQLGGTSTPEAMRKVLDNEQRRMVARLKDMTNGTNTLLKQVSNGRASVPQDYLDRIEALDPSKGTVSLDPKTMSNEELLKSLGL